MAAGLPTVVSDYNGYRDTVRDGVDGFRIATWAPEPGRGGEAYALRHELNLLNYDRYCWAASAATSVDIGQLVERLTALIGQSDLRKRMGDAARARARETFDWAHVFRQYQTLWTELNARRAAAVEAPDEQGWIAGGSPEGCALSPRSLRRFRPLPHRPDRRRDLGRALARRDPGNLPRPGRRRPLPQCRGPRSGRPAHVGPTRKRPRQDRRSCPRCQPLGRLGHCRHRDPGQDGPGDAQRAAEVSEIATGRLREPGEDDDDLTVSTDRIAMGSAAAGCCGGRRTGRSNATGREQVTKITKASPATAAACARTSGAAMIACETSGNVRPPIAAISVCIARRGSQQAFFTARDQRWCCRPNGQKARTPTASVGVDGDPVSAPAPATS